MNEQRYKLLIFDLDGTLVKPFTPDILPGVKERLGKIDPALVKLAIATNQAGPACHDAGWSFSEKFSSFDEVEKILLRVLASFTLAAKQHPMLYVAWWYQDKNGKEYVPSRFAHLSPNRCPAISPFWRKPEPGMLLAATREAGVCPEETLMVGDRETDQEAASRAGTDFVWAWQFFDWPDPEGQV
jgi:HAD superfamily hydrolase (TIGR01662 family)